MELPALDHIAHEFGHGVIFTSAGFPPGDPVGLQLHEGFADVIGQIVEKLRQPAGTGPERSSDWDLHEDGGLCGDGSISGYVRSGERDDSSQHWWSGPGGSYPFNNILHLEDDPPSGSAHENGNKLNVALRLVTVGGQNPVCGRMPWLSGCNVSVNAIGQDRAFRIFFTGLQYYLPSNSNWNVLAAYLSLAAWDLYRYCPHYPATYEQQAINKAFAAIGHPNTGEPFNCTPW